MKHINRDRLSLRSNPWWFPYSGKKLRGFKSLTRLLHNHTATALQHRFFAENLPFVVLPIRVGDAI